MIRHHLVLLREAEKHSLKVRGVDRSHKLAKKSDAPRRAEEKD